MPNKDEFSCQEANTLQLRGGGWTVSSALDIGSQAHAYVQVAAATRTVLLFPDSMCYYRWDMSTSDTISTANDMLINAIDKPAELPVPYDLGQQPVLHLKQVISKAGEKCRVVQC